MPRTVNLVYFSPTGTTRNTLTAVARGMGATSVEDHDLTRARAGIDLTLDDGIALIGFPVYAGRVPELFRRRIERLRADGIPAVIVALYGNRAFEDALVEMRDLCRALGFSVIAAAAFVGEHSYATPSHPIALGRPSASDLSQAAEFGALVAASLKQGTSAEPVIPGNFPYKELPPLGGTSPETDAVRCTHCGACAKTCPTFAIEIGAAVTTREEECIKCCACTRSCPVAARTMNDPLVAQRRRMLMENCSEPKKPEFFL